MIGAKEQTIEIEAADARISLRQFSLQAHVNLIYSPEDVEGVLTNPVQGSLQPREALQVLLDNTDLHFNEDLETGAFAIVRPENLSTNLPGNNPGDTPNPSETGEENMKTERSYIGRIATAIFGAAIVATTGAIAQDTEEEVFELSPFQVDASQDMGYVATSTLTGSRLNTRLEDVAASVSVFTEEFLNDVGLSDIQDIAKYSLSTVNGSQDTTASGDDNDFQSGSRVVRQVRLRGIRGTKGLDYFQSYVPDDGYRVSRYDESRGPNGILFGISDPGGIVNTTTRRANTRIDTGRLRYSADDEGRNRAEAYYNKVLIDRKLGVTLAGLYQDSENWRNFVEDKRERIYGAIMWEPTKKLSISINGETGDHGQTRYRRYAAANGYEAWIDNGRPIFELTGNSPSSSERAVGVVDSYGSGNRVIYIANEEFGIPSFFQGGRTYYTAGYEDRRVDGSFVDPDADDVVERIPRIVDSEEFPYPRELNAVGPGSYRDTEFDTYTLNADYRILDNLNFNIAHNMQKVEVDNRFTSGSDPVLRGDPNATILNPGQVPDGVDNLANPYAGRLYFDGYWRRDIHRIDYEETRAALSYDFDLTDSDNGLIRALGRHRAAAAYSFRDVSDWLEGHYFAFLGAPFDPGDYDDTRNRLRTRNYITEGDFTTYYQPEPPTAGPVSVFGLEDEDLAVDWVNRDAGTSNARSDVEVESKILALQSNFFNDRLTTTIGWRHDRANNVAFGHIEDPDYGDTITTDPDAGGYRIDDPLDSYTRTYGAVFDLTKNFSLVANYATSIGLPEFRNVVLPDSQIPNPIDGEGYDLGIAFSLNEGRISGRLVYYDVEQVGLTTSGGVTRIFRNPMQESMEGMTDIYDTDPTAFVKPGGGSYSQSEWDALVEELGPEFNAVYQDVVANGWELTVTANLTDNWRLSLNASYTDRTLSDYGREFIQLAGYDVDERGLAIQAVTIVGPDGPADNPETTVDLSALRSDGLHYRILELANSWVGGDANTLLTDNDSAGGGSFDVNDATVAYQMYDSVAVMNYEKSIREGRLGLNEYKFNVFTAYDFTEGKLAGFTLGGGVRYLGPKVMGTDYDGVEIESNSETDFDLMLRYRQDLRGGNSIDYQVNVYNLFDKGGFTPERHVILADVTTPLARYQYREPRHIRFTITYNF